MWNPKVITNQKVSDKDFEGLHLGQIPALIIKGIYSKNQCASLVKKIEKSKTSISANTQLEHIGPFLMSHVTNHKEYFRKSKEIQNIQNYIFEGMPNPLQKISNIINETLPSFSISLAKQSEEHFSPFVIRIHRKGKSIPIHKDNVKYEGMGYSISNIDYQLSGVLHLQESELGGDVIIYKNQWEKKDEKYRNIDFGYTSNVITKESCKISDINKGDLVMINPNYYHQVTKILGETPRITLGMFLGIYNKNNKIVTWA